jgi:hypothetical protein
MDLVVCPNCQWEQVGGTECQRCGVIFDRYKPPDDRPIFEHEVEETEVEITPPSLARRLFRIALWSGPIFTILILFLILRLAAPPQVASDPEAAAHLQEKLTAVREAIDGGSAYTAELTEAEVNSLIWLAMNPDQGSTEGASATKDPPLHDVRAKLGNRNVEMYIAFSALGKTLTLTTKSSLVVEGRRVRLDPQSGALGSLPLPRFVLRRIYQRAFDAPSTREALRLPDAVEDVRIEDNRVIITVVPSAADNQLMTVVD